MNLVIIFGGISSEHDISCISAASVLRNTDREKYTVYAVGITQEGKWFLYPDADADKVQSGEWKEEALVRAVISPDRGMKSLLAFYEAGVESISIDCVFPVLHGIGGEDGMIQGLLSLADIPYVGCGVAASAVGMDKSLTKLAVERTGVRQAAYYLAFKDAFERNPEQVAKAAMEQVGAFPLFVKACSGGSSVGVSKATDEASLLEAFREAFNWDEKALVEEFIDGQEIEVAVLGNDSPVASTAGEIEPTQEFYTFDAKYNDSASKLYIPARINEQAMEEVRDAAIRVYRAVGCRGLARVDFFCKRGSGELVFNEINTIPGFTGISMYPKLFAEDGIEYPRLIDKLIAFALEGHVDG